MIHVLATILLKPGKRATFLEEFHRIVPEVHKEAGCIEYGPAVDLPTSLPMQEPLRADVAVIIEKWESVEALKAHMQAPHMLEYRGRVKDLVEKVQLQILGPA